MAHTSVFIKAIWCSIGPVDFLILAHTITAGWARLAQICFKALYNVFYLLLVHVSHFGAS